MAACCCALCWHAAMAQDTFKLAPPLLRCPDIFFETSTMVSLHFTQAGAHIHYTTNGQIPTEKDALYTGPVSIKQHNTTLRARVFAAGFRPSDPVAISLYQRGLPVESVQHPAPKPAYPGSGSHTLIDGKGGIPLTGSNTWMGFQQDTVLVQLQLKKRRRVKQALVEVLKNQGAWIFSPQTVEVWAVPGGGKSPVKTGQLDLPAATQDSKSGCQALLIDTRPVVKTDRYFLKMYNLKKIPDWHQGKGTPPWLFVDEIKLY